MGAQAASLRGLLALALIFVTACGGDTTSGGASGEGGADDDGGSSSSGGNRDGGVNVAGNRDGGGGADGGGSTECEAGFEDCDGDSDNGCETDLSTTSNCGSCDNACSAENARVSCNNGMCVQTACNTGFADCDKDTDNGCEIDLSSKFNCNSCGNDCGMGDCMGGACTSPMCDTATTLKNDCDGDPSTGCETDVNTLTDCGNCRVGCDLPNASETCDTGTCAVVDCDSGYGNCDMDAPGCEQELNTKMHCGDCNDPCAYDNAAADCSTGTCVPGSCADNFGDCNMDMELDGCERLLTTLSDCGDCNDPCAFGHGSAACDTGLCTFKGCDAGWFDVNGNVISDGCECQDNLTHSSCGTAHNLGVLSYSPTGVVSYEDKLVEAASEDWYTFTLQNANRASHSIKIDFSSNPGGIFTFDLVDSCVGGGDPYSCGTGAVNSTGIKEYFFGDLCSGTGCRTNSSNGQAFSTTAPTVFLVKVKRSGPALSCSKYTLRVTRD